jgi:hypothetical protein
MTLLYERLNVGPSDELGYLVAIEVLLDGLDGGDLEKIKLYIENKLSTNNTPFNSFDELDEDELPF